MAPRRGPLCPGFAQPALPPLEGSSSAGGGLGALWGGSPCSLLLMSLRSSNTMPAPRPWTPETSPWKVAGGLAGGLVQVGLEGPNLQTLPEKGVLKHFRGVGSGVTARISQVTVLNHSLPGAGARGRGIGQVRHWPEEGVVRVPCVATLPRSLCLPRAPAAPSHLLGAPGAPILALLPDFSAHGQGTLRLALFPFRPNLAWLPRVRRWPQSGRRREKGSVMSG